MKQAAARPTTPLLGNDSYRVAVESAFNHIIITDVEGTVLFANAAAETMTGYSRKELIGSNPRLWGGQMDRGTYDRMWHTLKVDRKPFRGELTNKRKSGELYRTNAVISPIIGPDGDLIGFIGTEEDVTRQREAEELKAEFVSITSHQLLTPLTATKWAVTMLERSSSNLDGEQIGLLTTIDGMNERLLRLVTLLQNIAMLESGTFAPKMDRCDIPSLLEQARVDLGRVAEKRGIAINLRTGNGRATTMGDTHLLIEAIENILANAIKYSLEGGTVDLMVDDRTENIQVTIRDDGIGIPEKDRGRIFSKFFRASNAVSSPTEGSGLGLYFARMVIRSHRGTISFTSKEGKGTTFTISLPKT